jgi:hypothetical protein
LSISFGVSCGLKSACAEGFEDIALCVRPAPVDG